MSLLTLKNISKGYGQTGALNDVSLTLNAGEFGCVIGPNGCGKSTLLKIAAGILDADDGRVELGGTTSYLPQQLGLLPWKTALQNIILPLQIQNSHNEKLPNDAKKLLKKFKLEAFASHYPHQLSGGMQQKLALLRATVTSPDIMLLDEPFSALDAITRAQMQRWLIGLWPSNKPTVLMVTHDIREAILLSDRIFIMSQRPGTIKKVLKTSAYPTDKLEKKLQDLLI